MKALEIFLNGIRYKMLCFAHFVWLFVQIKRGQKSLCCYDHTKKKKTAIRPGSWSLTLM